MLRAYNSVGMLLAYDGTKKNNSGEGKESGEDISLGAELTDRTTIGFVGRDDSFALVIECRYPTVVGMRYRGNHHRKIEHQQQ